MYTKYSIFRSNIIIILMMTLFYAIPAWGDDIIKNGVVYNIDGDAATIVGYTSDISSSVVIPIIISEKNVTSIAADAFNNCSTLETITLPEHLESVGNNAFTGSGIKHITLNCTTIGQRWFERIKSQILTVTLGSTVQVIRDAAFSGFENVESITIPEGVTKIENLAFEGWKKLESINIPSSVNSISSTSFLGCTNLTVITVTGDGTYHSVNNAIIDDDNKLILGCKGTTTIPASVTAIGNDAFRGVGITSITIPSDVTSIGERAFNNTGITTITIPTAVISIGAGAFNSCQKLAQIIVAGGNTKYDSRDNCNAIIEKATNKLLFGCGETTIPSTITNIAQNAFYGVNKENFTVTIPDCMTIIDKGAFNGCTGLTSVTFPSGFTTIGEEAFKGCNGLRTFTIPTSVTTINQHAFQECNGLESVIIPANVISLGNEVWYNCANIKIVKIEGGNKVDSKLYLPTRTFKNCNKIEEIYFPNKAFYIEEDAFIGCKNIKKVYCQHSTSPYYPITESETIFDNELNLGNVTLYAFDNPSDEPWVSFKVPFIHFDWFDKKIGAAGDEIYYNIINTGSEVYAIVASDQPNDIHPSKNANLYSRTNITIPSTIVVDGFSSPLPVKYIERDAFNGKTEITTISFGNNIRGIDVSAFEGCTGITTIELSNTNLEEIGDEAFKNCGALTTINIPTTLTTLGKGAFYGCKITSATLPTGITTINDDTFRNCGELTTVTINGNVTTIGNNAFDNCNKLSSINLPSSLQTIGSEAFRSCLLLSSLEIPTNVNSVGQGAFRSCTGLTNVQFPNGLTTVEGNTFRDCSNITSLTLPGELTTIHQNAFDGCSGITSLVLPQHLKTIHQNAFSNCTNLVSISIQDEIETIGNQAFSGCTKIDNIYCFKQTPPEITGNSFEFTMLREKENPTKLYVPEDKGSAYQEHAIWKEFYVSNIKEIQLYNLKYVLDGEEPTVEGEYFIKVWPGTPVISKEEPTKEGHEFSGWIGEPEIMPAEDVNVTGNFKYTITYTIIDELEEEYRYLPEENNPREVEEEHFCGDEIVPPTSGHNGYIINWGANTPPTTMPKGGGQFNGSIERNKFTLTYKIWNQYNSNYTLIPGVEKLYKESIASDSNMPTPIPDDYVFEWDNYVSKMPAEDYEIEGHYIPQPVIEGIKYRFNSDESATARIIGFADANKINIVIPKTVEFDGSHQVTSINQSAFSGYTKLKSVTFDSPSNLTSIGMEAFRDCKALEKIEIPETVSDIGQQAFMNCTALQSVTIEKGEGAQLQLLKTRTFSGCTSLENITFPNIDGFQIEEFAFEGCSNIKKVYCLNDDYPGIKLLEEPSVQDTNPFNIDPQNKPTLYGKTEPTTEPWTGFNFINSDNVNIAVEAPVGNTLYYNIIGSGADAYAIVTNDQPDGLTPEKIISYNRETIIIPAEVTIGSITYPVKSIERKAFYGKEVITNVTFGANIESIEELAFEGCTGITALALDNTKLSIIGPEAFKGCTELANITLPATSTPLLQIGDEAFMNCAKLGTINMPAQIDLIGESAFEGCQLLSSSINTTVSNDIGTKAFKGCRKLESVVISGNISNIGANAFYGCDKLSSITLPNSITTIGASAFYDCKALKFIILPENLTSIGEAAFQNCSGLTSIILPENLTTIGALAFKGYTLNDIYCKPINAPTADDDSFDESIYNNESVALHLDANANDTYDTTTPWSDINKGDAIKTYSLVYKLDGEDYSSENIYGGTPITSKDEPTNGDHVFSGWIGEPEIMPAEDVTVTGNFKYTITYTITDELEEEYRYLPEENNPKVVEEEHFCGEEIVPPTSGHNGYIINWTTTLTTMPNEDLSINGSIARNKFTLTFRKYNVGDTEYTDQVVEEVLYKEPIDPNSYKPDPVENYEFEWDNCPQKMPAEDTTIEGHYVPQIETDGVKYRLIDGTTTAKVVGFTDATKTNLVIPKTVEFNGSHQVTSIDHHAFTGYTKLKSVTFESPSNLTSIGLQAFRDCKALEKIEIPETVSDIDKEAFMNCTALQSVTIEKGEGAQLTLLKTRTFSGCTRLESITFPNKSAFQIEEYAFEGCSNIKKVYCMNDAYPGMKVLTDEELTAIGKDSHDNNPFNIDPQNKPTLYGKTEPTTEPWTGFNFINSDNVNKAVEAPAGNKLYYNIIGSGADAYAIVTNDQPDELTPEKNISYNRKSIIIPDKITIGSTTYPVKSVERKAFYGKEAITSVTIGANIESIEESAFEGCTKLASVTLPTTSPTPMLQSSPILLLQTTPTPLLQIGDKAFKNCAKLETINMPAQIDLIGESAFEGCKLLGSSINTKVSNDIGNRAFYGCRKLESVVISGNISNIGAYAFYSCDKLSSITLPNSITAIGASAFYDCKALKSIILPENLTTIGEAAFQNCSGLTSIILPKNLTTIGALAFKGYTLKDIYCKPINAPTAKVNSFDDNVYGNKNVTLHLSANANATSYKTIPWKKIHKGGVIKTYSLVYKLDGVVASSENIYGGTPITPKAIPTKGDHAFSGWIGEPEIMPNEDVTVIGNFRYHLIYKFENVIKEDSWVFCGNSITAKKPSIPAKTGYTIVWSKDLDVMPAKDITITGKYVAHKHTISYVIDDKEYKKETLEYDKEIKLPNVPEIKKPFYIIWEDYPETMPDKDITIKGYCQAEIETNGLKIRVNKREGTAEVLRNTENSSATKVTIPETVTIKNVKYPVTSISKDAFSGYRKLTSISIPKTVTYIGVQAFRDCQSLSELTLPEAIKTIDKDAFMYCYGLKKVICYASSVPNAHSDAFRNTNIKTKATLYVPKSMINKYKATTPWSEFYKIESTSSLKPDKPTGIDGIMIDGVKAEAFYTLEGRRIIKPQHGINLVRLKDGRIVKYYFK